MPYRTARYYILFVIAVILLGFWGSYFAMLTNVPWQFHVHGIASSIWVLMVLAQSWTVHKEQLLLHRAVGKTSLLLFPFLVGGLMAIIDLTAKRFVVGDEPVRTMFGGEFLIGLLLAIMAYVVLYYRALKYRRKVWLHSGYMLATPLILFESPLSRIFGTWMPGLAIRGPQDLHLVIDTIVWAMAVELVVVALLWYRFRDRASPFLVAGVFIIAQMLTMGLMKDNQLLEAMLRIIAQVPSAVVVMTGMAIGAATSWAGWISGRRPATTGLLVRPA